MGKIDGLGTRHDAGCLIAALLELTAYSVRRETPMFRMHTLKVKAILFVEFVFGIVGEVGWLFLIAHLGMSTCSSLSHAKSAGFKPR